MGYDDYLGYLKTNTEINSMKSNRLSPLQRFRSVRYHSANSEYVSEDDVLVDLKDNSKKLSSFPLLDLEQGYSFDIKQAKIDEFKKLNNVNSLVHALQYDEDLFYWAFAILYDSPAAFALINQVEESGWKFTLDHLDDSGYHLDVADNIIILNNYGLDISTIGQSNHYRHLFLITLMKSLRDCMHELAGLGIFEHYNAESIILLERARTADIDAITILMAWELRSAGYHSLWRFMVGSNDGDMAQILLNIMDRYPTALYNGTALAHVFRQWYVDEQRIDGCDHATLEYLDEFIDEQGFDVGKKSAKAHDFESLSLLPDGSSCYLNKLGETVAKDPFFNSFDDPINQAHLFQILYDSEVTYVGDIPFRDAKLAKKFL